MCVSQPARQKEDSGCGLYYLPRESRIGPSLYSFPPFSLVRFTRPEVHALPTFPERRSSWPQRDGRSTTLSSLFHHHLHAPPLSLSLSTPYLPLASLSLSLRALASFSPPSSPNSAVRRFRPSPREIPPPSRPPPLLLLLLFPQYHILLAPHQRVRAGSLVTLPRLRRSALHP